MSQQMKPGNNSYKIKRFWAQHRCPPRSAFFFLERRDRKNSCNKKEDTERGGSEVSFHCSGKFHISPDSDILGDKYSYFIK